MNDFLVLAPIHWDGEIICWSGIALHDVDVGGPVLTLTLDYLDSPSNSSSPLGCNVRAD